MSIHNKSVKKGNAEQVYNYFANGMTQFGNFSGTRVFSKYLNYIPRRMAQGVNYGTKKLYNFIIHNSK